MNLSSAVAVLFVACLSLDTPAFQAKPITAVTGAPELIETGGAGAVFAMTEADYQKLAGQLSKMAAFVPMTKKPDNVSAGVRFGINFSYAGKNRSWALDGNDTAGYTLYADINANGDLSDDTPMKFEKRDGKYSTYFETTVNEGAESYPMRFKLELDRILPPGETAKELALLRYSSTRRSGEIVVGGKAMKFSVGGQQGLYSSDYNGVRFDLNDDGVLEPRIESYLNSEKYVNIGDRTYEFSVDRFGRSLTLTPLFEKRPARVVLEAGFPSPEFSFTDLAGASRKLSDYRGKVVLLDFWGTWCGPCVAEAPRLVAAYEKYNARGFEILGIDSSDTKEKLQAFITDKKMPWAQTMEGEKGPIHTLWRITGWPSYFLIGKDGKIVVAAPGGGKIDLMTELDKLLPIR